MMFPTVTPLEISSSKMELLSTFTEKVYTVIYGDIYGDIVC